MAGGLPKRSVRDPRHANHKPPETPRCPPGECVAPAFVVLCPRCDHPVNMPRDEVVLTGEPVQEPWQLRSEDSTHG